MFHVNNKQLSIKINEQTIETVRNIKYLGVTIDRYLSFGGHIRTLSEKLRDRQNMLKALSGIKKGSQVMIQIYESLIRSAAEFGWTAHNHTCETNIRKLEVINNQCLRHATGLTRSTPLNILCAVNGQDSIRLRLEYIKAREIGRIFYRNNVIAK